MNRLSELESIFFGALELGSPAERTAYLDQACAADADLRRRVEKMLAAQARDGSFLERPAVASSVTAPEPMRETPGTTIGPYKLLEQIGEGGFGVVYMAEQTQPVRRKVALKILKHGMDTRQVVARFEAERQALAIMDHPNIAHVFDGGEIASGRPYFVMELVRGVPITEFCDRNHLPVRERLKLFIHVCQAVQHAHQKGIIHRDLKPTNVLVTLHDGTPVVKVIDFGIAKAMGQQLTEKTLFTNFAQMIGTPLYMSPEQAEMSGLDVDTRSDLYSLGVLLYELLTGTTPFDKELLKEVGYDEMRRIIREEEPAKPSTRVSTLGQAASTVSTNRQSDPKRLRQLFRGELDWIVMKALEKDRNRRYETANAFVLDIQRYLADEPVLACPPSAWYRFRKFARRNKAALATASVGGLALVVLATSLVLIAFEHQATQTAQQAEALAQDERMKADERKQQEFYYHLITQAHRDVAIDLLEECPKDLRGWEWHYLRRLCRVEPVVIREQTEMNGLAFSRDGERLVSAGGDGYVKIWNSRTGKELLNFSAHTDSVVCVAFHPDGKHVASAGADRTVKVWDLTAISQPVFEGPCDPIRRFGTAYTVAFSPDGRKLAAGSEGDVRVWDWQNRQHLHSFSDHNFHSISVAFHPDGRRLATSGSAKVGPRLWDADAGGPPLYIFPSHRHPVGALAFSPDGERLASASFDRTVKLWDTTTKKHVRTFLHKGNAECVAFSPDGRHLASSGEDKTVHLWDAETGRELIGLRGHTARCHCVAFSPDGWRLASASTDGTIRFWDATPLRPDEGQENLTYTFPGHSEEVYTVAFSPDGQWIASAGYDPFVKVWNPQTHEVREGFRGNTIVVFCVAWSPDGMYIASAGSEGLRHAVKVFNARTGQEAFPIRAGRDFFDVPFQAVAFSPDGRYLVTGKVDGAVQVWDAATGKEVGTLGTHNRVVRGVVFSRKGGHLASSSDGKVKLWDATRLDQKQEARHTLPARVPGMNLNVAFSPDGRWLATAAEENTLKIWNVETGKELPQTFRGHSGEVYAIAFSPDGRWIASGSEDSTVKIWDSDTGRLERTFRGHTGLVSSLSFSPDGRRLVSGSRDKTVKVWDVTALDKE